MPYFKRRGKRKYEYKLASGQFSPNNLDPDSRQVFDALRQLGAKIVYCKYNGGGDEGFAQLSGVKLEDKVLEWDELKQQLAEGTLGGKTSPSLHGDNYLRKLSREQRVERLVDLFTSSLAICLLGQGYGTGEYSMKGSFRADLESGEIIDEQGQ